MAMIKITAAVTPTAFHAGTVGGLYRFTVSPGTSQDVATNEATFDLTDGDYVATAQRLDDSGNVLGEFSAPFSVPLVPNVLIDVPTGLSFSEA
jgi:hypothetical protein